LPPRRRAELTCRSPRHPTAVPPQPDSAAKAGHGRAHRCGARESRGARGLFAGAGLLGRSGGLRPAVAPRAAHRCTAISACTPAKSRAARRDDRTEPAGGGPRPLALPSVRLRVVADATLRPACPARLTSSCASACRWASRAPARPVLVDAAGTIIDEYGPRYADCGLPIIDGIIVTPCRSRRHRRPRGQLVSG